MPLCMPPATDITHTSARSSAAAHRNAADAASSAAAVKVAFEKGHVAASAHAALAASTQAQHGLTQVAPPPYTTPPAVSEALARARLAREEAAVIVTSALQSS
eukprot:Rhum_TRINITY_DN13569_c0_g2::Rhum_TRINITY_DN13569_c0_g2_i2::g.61322::m.61322